MKNKRPKLLATILFYSFVLSAQVQVSKEPRHKNVLENKYIRLLDVKIQPGDTSLFHIHSIPSVFVHFTNGASEVKDLMGAGLYLKNRADVDAKKIALWGGSYGGYLTAHGLAQASDIFACGVDIHGVHNWNDEIPTFAPWYDASKFPVIAKKALESSPVYYIKGWKSPVLLIHGDDDRNVPFSESVNIAELLRKQGVYIEQLVLPDEVHSFLLHRNWLKIYNASFEFIQRQLNQQR